jgi:hypothetical protein
MEEMIEARRNAVRGDWPVFKRQPPFLVAEVIDRDETELPSDFCPWAPGIVIASDYLLHAAGHTPGSPGPTGWTEGQPDVFTKVMHGNRLMVRGRGEFWSVEREDFETLAFLFGPVPMFTRTRHAAMRLAEYCHPEPREGEFPFPKPRGTASGLRWVIRSRNGIFWNIGGFN